MGVLTRIAFNEKFSSFLVIHSFLVSQISVFLDFSELPSTRCWNVTVEKSLLSCTLILKGLWSSHKTNEQLKPDRSLTSYTPAKQWVSALTLCSDMPGSLCHMSHQSVCFFTLNFNLTVLYLKKNTHTHTRKTWTLENIKLV